MNSPYKLSSTDEDLIEVKVAPGLRQPWKKARICEILPHSYRVRLEGEDTLQEIPLKRTRPISVQKAPNLVSAAKGFPPAERSPYQGQAFPKPLKRVLDKDYIAFVHTRTCCACGTGHQIEAHHFGPRGTGQKTHDYNATPCCMKCHHQFHATGTFQDMSRIETEHAIYKGNRDALVAWLIGSQPGA